MKNSKTKLRCTHRNAFPFYQRHQGCCSRSQARGKHDQRIMIASSKRGKKGGALLKCLLCNKNFYVGRYYYSHFTEKETEVLRRGMTFLQSAMAGKSQSQISNSVLTPNSCSFRCRRKGGNKAPFSKLFFQAFIPSY